MQVEQPVQTTVDPAPDTNQPMCYVNESMDDSSQLGPLKTPVTQNNQVKKQIVVLEDQGLVIDSGAGDGLIIDGNSNSSTATGEILITNSNSNGGGCGGGSNSNSNGAANNAAGDLYDKFNQFSDLIVVNPEQLGLKRPSTNEDSEVDNSSDQAPPPAKKRAISINGNDAPVNACSNVPLPSSAISTASQPSVGLAPATSSSVLQTALSSPGSSSQKIIKTEYPLSVVQNQLLQLPIKLTIDRNNPNLLSFSGGKFVMRAGAGGTPLIFSPTQLSGNQMIYSKSSGTNEIPKIYLVPSNQPSQSSLPQQMTMTVVHDSSHTPGQGQGVVNLATLVPKPDGVPPQAYSHVPPEEIENEIPFLCEWAGCNYRFSKPQFVSSFRLCAQLF
jgi:hypothetical protein